MNTSLFLTNLCKVSGLSILVCYIDGTVCFDANQYSNFEKVLFADICKSLQTTAVLVRDVRADLPIHYYACTDKKYCYVIGPVAHEKLSHEQSLQYRKIAGSYADRLLYAGQIVALSTLSMILEVNCGISCSPIELQIKLMSQKSNINAGISPLRQQIRQMDQFQSNHSYAEEQRFLEYIRAGDVHAIQKKLSTLSMAYPAPVTDPHKNNEYMCVALLSVVSRAAIVAGVSSPESFLYSDEFMRKISEAKDELELLSIRAEIILTYAQLVHQMKFQESRSLLASRCKRLIKSNLFTPLSLSALAKELGVSAEHLSRCFKEETGTTVTHYFLSKRMDVACEMLANSDMSVSNIAQYLQFNSLSYFITTFKKYKEVTPGQYRKIHLI